jgi:hypothetical protein
MADVGGWPRIPQTCLNTGGLGKDVVPAVSDLAQLLDRLIRVAALGG